MRHLALSGLLTVLCLGPFTGGASIAATPLEPAPQGDATSIDPEMQTLLTDFGRLYRALRNSRGLRDEDRPALEAMLTRVEAHLVRNPDSTSGVALGLQLSKWLGDEARVGEYYDRLTALLPADAELAISRLKHRETTDELSEEELLAAYEELNASFPGSREVVGSLATQLKRRSQYVEAIAALRAADLVAAEDTQEMYDLADCLFVEHEFEEAKAIIDELAELQVTEFQLRSNIERMKTTVDGYIEFWKAEQELREQELSLTAADELLPRLAIQTERGMIVVELFENEAPNTVANYVSLAESGFYNGTRFHRWEPDFMIQGGDPLSKLDSTETGAPGTGNPGYFIPDEHTLDNHRKHFRDSIAMAKTTAPNSGGCQFYLNHRPTPWLNGLHTVFGRVIEGQEIARSLEKDDEIISITVLQKRDHAYEPSTLPLPTAAATP